MSSFRLVTTTQARLHRGRALNRRSSAPMVSSPKVVAQNKDRLVAEYGHPLIDARRFGTTSPKGSHDVRLAELVRDVAPEQRLRVLMTAKGNYLGRAKSVCASQLRRNLAAERGVGGEQSERDQAVRLT